MADAAFINLDLPAARFARLSATAKASFEAGLDAEERERAAAVRILMVARDATGAGDARAERLKRIEARLAAEAETLAAAKRVLVLECVDAASEEVVADFAVLRSIFATIGEAAATPPETAAMALRYRETVVDVFSPPTLAECTLTTLEDAFDREAVLALFSRALDANGVELDLAGFGEEGLAVIEALVRETTAGLGLSDIAGAAFDEALRDALS